MMGQLVGEIRLFAYDAVPEGWMLCDGSLLSIREHLKLYTMLGTKFGGGDGFSFRLPDLRGETRPGFAFCIAIEGDIPNMNSPEHIHMGG